MDIELYSKMNDPMDAIERVGQFFAASGMFGCEKREQGMVLAMACIAEKKSPIEIKRCYHLQQGELSMRADAMLAEFRNRGGKHKVISRTAELASVELTGTDGDKQTFSFSWEDAKKEPFVWTWKDPVTKQQLKEPIPKKNYATPRTRMQMLWARVISDAVRTMAPEIVSGTYTPEEIDDNAPSNVAPLLPEKPAPAMEQQPAASPVIDVVTAPEGSSVSTTPHEPKLAGPGILAPETVEALEVAIGPENAEAALAWLKGNNWITTNLSQLSVKRASRILKNPAAFIETVKGIRQ
jgi:hypothetical protein